MAERLPDRILLEDRILPWFARESSLQRLVWVGCDAYTAAYPASFAHKADFITLDVDPSKSPFGGPRHVVGSVLELTRHVPGSVDAILMNGVLGFGVDSPRLAELSLLSCRLALRPGGVLLLGWNDVPGFRPLSPHQSRVLASMERVSDGPLPLGVERVEYSLDGLAWVHVYELFRRAA